VTTNVSEKQTASIFTAEEECLSETLLSTYESTGSYRQEDKHRYVTHVTQQIFKKYWRTITVSAEYKVNILNVNYPETNGETLTPTVNLQNTVSVKRLGSV
jgi:hypothetical protein